MAIVGILLQIKLLHDPFIRVVYTKTVIRLSVGESVGYLPQLQ